MYVYPRLPAGAALEELKELRRLRTGGRPEWRRDHPRAVYAPHGSRVPETVLEEVRARVEEAVAPLPRRNGVRRQDVARWDRVVGAALHSSMRIVDADAAAEGVWSFLTLVLLPDLAVERFPLDSADARFLGLPRNVFRRTWERHRVIGDLEPPTGVKPLGEDELVGLLERSAMARNHRLVRLVAAQVLLYEGTDRSNSFARPLAKLVAAETGPFVLDLLGDEELAQLVGDAAQKIAPGTPRVEARTVLHSDAGEAGDGAQCSYGSAPATEMVVPSRERQRGAAEETESPEDGAVARLVDMYHRANPIARQRELAEVETLVRELLEEYSEEELRPAVREAVSVRQIRALARELQREGRGRERRRGRPRPGN